ncbi:hypothetical protein BZZ01_17470 [Nostocales cyanobacterium HT-58-2]|nr:hypothetical protein BZZ01_17470 [Nostocales cyanobacterium HT-58-2]
MAEKKDLAEQNSDKKVQADEPNDLSNTSQTFTPSYGTGVHTEPGYNIGDRKRRYRTRGNEEASPLITGGDIDEAWELEADVGDHAIGGTAPTPDQDIVEEIAAGVGVEINDDEPVRVTEMLEERDDSRWELDPLSSEDYEDRHKKGIEEGEIERLDTEPNQYGGSSRSLAEPGNSYQETLPVDDNV